MAPPRVPRVPGWVGEKLKHPLVVAGAIKLGVSLGQEAGKLRRGEVSLRQFKAHLGRHVGGMTGTATGVAVGAWAGSVVPGVGTVLGAFGGGLAGQMLGEMVTIQSAERVRPEPADAGDGAPGSTREAPAHPAPDSEPDADLEGEPAPGNEFSGLSRRRR